MIKARYETLQGLVKWFVSVNGEQFINVDKEPTEKSKEEIKAIFQGERGRVLTAHKTEIERLETSKACKSLVFTEF